MSTPTSLAKKALGPALGTDRNVLKTFARCSANISSASRPSAPLIAPNSEIVRTFTRGMGPRPDDPRIGNGGEGLEQRPPWSDP